MVLGDPTGSFLVVGPRKLELVSSLGRVSPQLPCGPILPMSVGLSSQTFSGFRVDPESISVFSGVGEGGRCHSTCLHPHFFTVTCPIFSLFHDLNALRPKVLLQPWNGWQAYAFPPFALLYAILLMALLVLWGPRCPWFSGASGSG